MTDKENIIAEVVRYKNEIIKDNEGTDYEMGFIAALESVETFISNLPEEPASEDLEEAAAKYDRVLKVYNEREKLVDTSGRKYFKLGAQWQREQYKKGDMVMTCEGITLQVNNESNELGLMEGDKVRVIIYKEDEK